MKPPSLFEEFWLRYSNKPKDRKIYFQSLSLNDQTLLIKSFYKEGWKDQFMQDQVDHKLDDIKSKYNIDLINLRIQAIKFGRIFIIEKHIWEEIENLILPFDICYDIDIIFGGLLISLWGRKKQCYLIKANSRNKWRSHE